MLPLPPQGLFINNVAPPRQMYMFTSRFHEGHVVTIQQVRATRYLRYCQVGCAKKWIKLLADQNSCLEISKNNIKR